MTKPTPPPQSSEWLDEILRETFATCEHDGYLLQHVDNKDKCDYCGRPINPDWLSIKARMKLEQAIEARLKEVDNG